MASFFARFISRRIEALLVCFTCGIIGVLIDLDHILCGIIGVGRFDPSQGQYGCRLWHPLLLPLAISLGGVAFALGLGLLAYLVFDAFRPSA
jgi:hypothetical protein